MNPFTSLLTSDFAESNLRIDNTMIFYFEKIRITNVQANNIRCICAEHLFIDSYSSIKSEKNTNPVNLLSAI